MLKKLSLILTISLVVLGTTACSASSQSTSTSKPVETISENVSKTAPETTSNTAKESSISNSNDAIGAAAAKNDKDLTLSEMLTYSIQDEYLAHAEYEYILKTFGNQRPFSNIIKAEESHISMLKPILQKYNIEIPVDNSKDHLIIPKNINESLEAGVQAEIDNIAMYEQFLKLELPEDVKTLFVELMNASKSHLDAFQKNLNK